MGIIYRLQKYFDLGSCAFCHKGSKLSFIEKHGIYDTDGWIYHKACLEDVINNPPNYSHLVVDMALEIKDLESYENRSREQDIQVRNLRLSKYQKHKTQE